jgi:hypothetical protein
MKLLHHETQDRARGNGEQERNTTYTVSSVTGRRTASKSVYLCPSALKQALPSFEPAHSKRGAT